MKTPIEELICNIDKLKTKLIDKESLIVHISLFLENEKQAIIDSIVEFQKQKRLNNPIIGLGDNWKEIDEKYFRDLAEQYYNQKYNK